MVSGSTKIFEEHYVLNAMCTMLLVSNKARWLTFLVDDVGEVTEPDFPRPTMVESMSSQAFYL